MSKRQGLGTTMKGNASDRPALSPNELQSRLWECANILRGSPVDRADFKTYIFPLLFFKRISDVWDDEVEEIMDEFGDP